MPTHIKIYQQAIEYLTRRVNYERSPAGSYSRRNFKLDRMRWLLSLLGNPQKRIPVIHIAGTKGKGSTAEMVSRMLIAGGYRVGLFTSPHVSAFEERMTVDGNAPLEKQLVELVNRFLLQARQNMRIGIERNGDGGMAKALTHHLGVDALDKKRGGMCVAQIVKP